MNTNTNRLGAFRFFAGLRGMSFLPLLFLWMVMAQSAQAVVRINYVSSNKVTVSKGQTGIQIAMEVENLDPVDSTILNLATLTFSLGSYEFNLNSPALPTSLAAAGTSGSKVTCQFTASVNPLSPSGVCVVDGHVECAPPAGNDDTGADVTHSWTVQQPAELIITNILGPAEVSRGSAKNQAIMEVGRTGEANAVVNFLNLRPWVPTNYSTWVRTAPTLPQNFSRSVWWNNKWKYRKQMEITNRSTSTLPAAYEIAFSFDHAALVAAGKSLPSGDDIRIVYDDGVSYQDLTRYLDPLASAWNTTSTTIWFRLQAPINPTPASTKSYAVYYGASAADAAGPSANPAAVFVFDDTFENGVNGWTQGLAPTAPGGYADRWELGAPGVGDNVLDDDGQGPIGARSGTNVWATDLNDRYNDSGVSTRDIMYLRSPVISLVGKLNPTMTFWDWYDIENGGAYDYTTLKIYQSPIPGTELLILENAYLNQHTPWQMQTYSLAPVVGKSVYVEFMFRIDWASNSYGHAIDDFRIRQIAVPEPDNPTLGVEEGVPLTPAIKAYYDVDVSLTAVSGPDTIDGLASGTEGNTGQEISDNAAAVPLIWNIQAVDFLTFGNVYYLSPKSTFNVGETVYGKGSGYATGTTYLVEYSNPSDVVVETGTVVPNTDKEIFYNRTLQVSDVAGKWIIRVKNSAATTVLAQTSFNLNTPAQLVSGLSLPSKLVTGQEFTLTHRVSNAGQTKALGVVPSPLDQFGTGTLLSVTGPTPSSQAIAGGESKDFVYTCVAGNPGLKYFRANAQGTMEGSTVAAVSASASSNMCYIATESLVLSTVYSAVTDVNLGEKGLPVSVSLRNDSVSDLLLNELSVVFKQGVTDVSGDFTQTVQIPQLPITLPGHSNPPWWNTAYSYRQKLQIKSNVASFPAMCSSRITINTDNLQAAGKVLANRNDWRVVRWNDTTQTWAELDRHYANSENTWFRLQADVPVYGIDESYFIYYGNTAAAAAPATLNSVYFFFENWEAGAFANGFTNFADGVPAAFPNWTVARGGQDYVSLCRNQGLQRDAQTICLRRLDFGTDGSAATNWPGLNVNAPHGEIRRMIDARNFPGLKLSFWRWYDDNGDWGGGATNIDWSRVRVSPDNGTTWNDVAFFPANGPDDETWHYEEYDLSGFPRGQQYQIAFEANFWYGGAADTDRIVYDDIRLWMEAPDAFGQGEETQPVTTLTATFSVDIGLTAPLGVVTLDAAATCTSVIATGTIVDTAADTTDSWNVLNYACLTYEDDPPTVEREIFSRGEPIVASASGLLPSTAVTMRWFDAFTGGTLRFTDNVVSNPSGVAVSAPRTPAAAHQYGLWRVEIVQSGSQRATGTFRLLEKPFLLPKMDLQNATSTLGDSLTATLQVHSCLMGDNFTADTSGSAPASWTPVAGLGTVQVNNNTTYATNPPGNYLTMFRTGATTMRITRAVPMPDCYSQVLTFDYSLIINGVATLTLDVSADGGGIWTSIATYAAHTGANIWETVSVSLPPTLANNRNAQVRFTFVTDATGEDRVCLDNIFIQGTSLNHETVTLEPVIWTKDPTSSGNAVVVVNPTPANVSLTCGDSTTFTAEYTATALTVAGQFFRLHGLGAPAILASGASAVDGTTLNVADEISKGVKIFQEALTVTPDPANLGSCEPGQRSATFSLTITNTGNLDLEHIDWEMHNLSDGPNSISYGTIEPTDDPVGALVIAGTKAASVTVNVPPGTKAGNYTVQQFAFEDNDQNGQSTGDPIGQFLMELTVPPVERLRAGATSLDLGDWVPDDQTTTQTIVITNIGNIDLNIVRLVCSDPVSGGNTIPSSSFSILPVAQGLMVSGETKVQTFSLKIPPGQPTGTYIATATFLNDTNVNQLADAGEASFPVALSVYVGPVESFTVNTNPIDLPNSPPGVVAQSAFVNITNTGGIALEHLKFRTADITFAGRTIPKENVSFSPDPMPVIAPAGVSPFKTYVAVTFGTDFHPTQRLVGTQRLYNDKNDNGIWDATEKFFDFDVRIIITQSRDFTVAEEIANLGAGLPGQAVTANVDAINIGNTTCNRMKWGIITPLTSGADTIPVVGANYVWLEASTWSLDYPGEDHQISTLTVNIPAGTPVGVYTGLCTLIDHSITNDTIWQVGEASDTFLMQLEVGASGMDIVETSPFSVGSGAPGETTSPVSVSVKNTGDRTLTTVCLQKNDLTGPDTIAASAFTCVPDPIGLIGIGVTRACEIQVAIPANKPSGTYSSQFIAFQDDNENGVFDGGEPNDAVTLELTVLGKMVLSFSPTPLNMGGVTRGETVKKTFSGINLGNLDIAALNWTLPDLYDGGNSIPKSQLLLETPDTPWAIPWNGITSELATLTIIVPGTTPTGNYAGNIVFWEDTDGMGDKDADEPSWTLPVTISVGAKDLDILETALSFGTIQKGTDSSTYYFNTKNIGTVFLSNLRVIPSALGGGTIPISDLHFDTLQIAPPNLNPGVTRSTGLWIHTDVACPSGVYSGVQRVYEDIDNDGIFDAGEPTDTFIASITVNSGGALAYDMACDPTAIDFGTVGRGQAATASFAVTNVAGNELTNCVFTTADLTKGADILLAANILLSPTVAFSVPLFFPQAATASLLLVPTNLPAGTYTGTQICADTDHPPTAAPLILTVTIPTSTFNLVPLSFDFGTVSAGGNREFSFTVTNTGLNTIVLDSVAFDLIGPQTISFADVSLTFALNPLAPGLSTAGTYTVAIPPGLLPGPYIGTATIREFGFPDEASRTVPVTLTIANPIGNWLYQPITNPNMPNSVSPSTRYFFTFHAKATQTALLIGGLDLQIKEWRATDPINPLVINSWNIPKSVFDISTLSRYGGWVRLGTGALKDLYPDMFSFTSNSAADLGSFTVEFGFPGATLSGAAVLIDGVQLEKAIEVTPGVFLESPTPWVERKGVITPNFQFGLDQNGRYYSW
jgi:hypothetical protein